MIDAGTANIQKQSLRSANKSPNKSPKASLSPRRKSQSPLKSPSKSPTRREGKKSSNMKSSLIAADDILSALVAPDPRYIEENRPEPQDREQLDALNNLISLKSLNSPTRERRKASPLSKSLSKVETMNFQTVEVADPLSERNELKLGKRVDSPGNYEPLEELASASTAHPHQKFLKKKEITPMTLGVSSDNPLSKQFQISSRNASELAKLTSKSLQLKASLNSTEDSDIRSNSLLLFNLLKYLSGYHEIGFEELLESIDETKSLNMDELRFKLCNRQVVKELVGKSH